MSEEKAYVRFIGDLHGDPDQHLSFIAGAEYTFQIGDLGFRYAYLNEQNVDATRHRFIGGNHDNYDIISEYPHHLGDFGVWEIPEFGPVFYVRGAWSIDWEGRKTFGPYKSLWEQEELTTAQCHQAIELYTQVKPKLLVSHECPISILPFVTDPKFAYNMGYDDPVIKTRTNQMLQAMTEIHKPKMHIFGHYHRNFAEEFDGVRYRCIPIAAALDLPKNYVDQL